MISEERERFAEIKLLAVKAVDCLVHASHANPAMPDYTRFELERTLEHLSRIVELADR